MAESKHDRAERLKNRSTLTFIFRIEISSQLEQFVEQKGLHVRIYLQLFNTGYYFPSLVASVHSVTKLVPCPQATQKKGTSICPWEHPFGAPVAALTHFVCLIRSTSLSSHPAKEDKCQVTAGTIHLTLKS